MEDAVIENSGSAEIRPESSDVNGDANASHQRGAAWNRPFNGAAETGPVMGGSVSWPALSKSTSTVVRSPSDLSAPSSRGLPSSSSQTPLISQQPQRQISTAATSSNTLTPRSRGRGGGGRANGSVIGTHHGYNQAYTPTFEHPSNSSVGGGGVGASRAHIDSDHSYQRNNSRRGNFGGRGPHHNNHGGGRGRGQGRRDVYHFQPQHPYIPPHQHITYVPVPPPMPAGASHYMAPVPTRAFPYDMASTIFLYPPPLPMESYRGMQITPPPQPPPALPPRMNFGPANGNDLTSSIVGQIAYYFSDLNLETDDFLKSHMDNQGWVPIALVASFPRIKSMTNDIFIVRDALRYSSVVEVQDGKMRKRHGWERYIKKDKNDHAENNDNTNGNTI